MYGSWLLAAQPPARKKQKKSSSKSKASCWFEKATVDELKQLCKAALLPVSGTKAKLVERLLTGEKTSRFAYEYAPPRFSMRDFNICYDSDSSVPRTKSATGTKRPDGLSMDCLKTECRDKGLVVGGKRFDLILRLLQSETSAQTGIEPKRARGTFNEETGKFEPKQRAKSMKLPDPSKLGERMHKKCNPPDSQVMNWSNQKYKDHAMDCIGLCNSLLQKEVVEKELFERGEVELAWKVVTECIRYWIYHDGRFGSTGGGDVVTGMGYVSYELGVLHDLLMKFLEQTTEAGKADKLADEWGIERLLWDMFDQAQAYGQFDEIRYYAELAEYFPRDE